MGGDQDFKSLKHGNLLDQFPGNLVRKLRGEFFLWREGLDKVLVGPSAHFAIELLRQMHFLPDGIRIAVEAV